MIVKKFFYYLIDNTSITDKIPQTEEEALKYLQYISSSYFAYKNDNNYDAYDYEKIIYIEMNFSNNIEIQNIIQKLKLMISNSYAYKNKYLNRIRSKIFTEQKLIDSIAAKQYRYQLPDENDL